jgi:nitrite reductase (NADH) small subunit
MMAETRSAGNQPLATSHQPPSAGGTWVAVCRLNDIVPNTGVCALVGGRQVAVFRLDDDRLYAIDNHDPFSHANVLSRGIVGDIKGEVVVASPVYKQHFSLASGQCLEDPQVRVPVFPARLDGDVVYVEC